MKRKPLLIILLILIPFVSLLIYITSLAMVPYGEYCSGTVSPDFHVNCEFTLLGNKVFNPILSCKHEYNKALIEKSVFKDIKGIGLEGGSGTCVYRWSN